VEQVKPDRLREALELTAQLPMKIRVLTTSARAALAQSSPLPRGPNGTRLQRCQGPGGQRPAARGSAANAHRETEKQRQEEVEEHHQAEQEAVRRGASAGSRDHARHGGAS
jgi:hypothetical protein